MKPFLTAATAALAAGAVACGAMWASAAWADTSNDASLRVSSGMWNWHEKAKVLGFTVTNKKKSECMIEEEVDITLSGLAYDLDETCTVNSVAPVLDGYTFKLVCGGKYAGKADGNISLKNQSLAISAKGTAKWNGIPAGFTWQTEATYAGACSAEDYAREKAKWDAKHPDGE